MLEPTIGAGTRHSLRCVCPAHPADSIFTCLKRASSSMAAHGHRMPDASSSALVQRFDAALGLKAAAGGAAEGAPSPALQPERLQPLLALQFNM